jgi:hypothetical protein
LPSRQVLGRAVEASAIKAESGSANGRRSHYGSSWFWIISTSLTSQVCSLRALHVVAINGDMKALMKGCRYRVVEHVGEDKNGIEASCYAREQRKIESLVYC